MTAVVWRGGEKGLRSNANGEVTVVACGGNASNSRDGFEHKLWGKMNVTAEMSQKDEKIIMVHVSALGSDGPKVRYMTLSNCSSFGLVVVSPSKIRYKYGS
ncbi:unnamed protein product [Sphagnum jensenii]|uniref:Uncharacterized protein n=1 Tax=Sphagnum jensenii TaxID=128206 RepID=A0ABP1A2B0_9BRYO